MFAMEFQSSTLTRAAWATGSFEKHLTTQTTLPSSSFLYTNTRYFSTYSFYHYHRTRNPISTLSPTPHCIYFFLSLYTLLNLNFNWPFDGLNCLVFSGLHTENWLKAKLIFTRQQKLDKIVENDKRVLGFHWIINMKCYTNSLRAIGLPCVFPSTLFQRNMFNWIRLMGEYQLRAEHSPIFQPNLIYFIIQLYRHNINIKLGHV